MHIFLPNIELVVPSLHFIMMSTLYFSFSGQFFLC